jgi:hypothetical protein
MIGSWVHKFVVLGCPGDYILYVGALYWWDLRMELVFCHPSGVYNFEVASRFLENLCTLGELMGAINLYFSVLHIV